jgi:hypothetical protein
MGETKRILIGEIATAHVDEDGAAFHLREHSGIEELLGLRCGWAVRRDNVALRKQFVE